MRITLFSALFALTTISAASAQDVSECAAISDPDDRLNCFDAAFLEVSTPPTESKWRARIDRSQLDDSETVVLRLESDDAIQDRFGQQGPATLILRCMENTTSAYITFAGQFMADIQGRGRVDYRVDNRPANHKNMRVSTDNKALGLWSGGGSIPFIKEMMDGQQLYVRATPFSESAVEATFTIAGLNDELPPLRGACNW